MLNPDHGSLVWVDLSKKCTVGSVHNLLIEEKNNGDFPCDS